MSVEKIYFNRRKQKIIYACLIIPCPKLFGKQLAEYIQESWTR